MDCASEESEIRRAVEGVPGVLGLRFQLGERSLRIAGEPQAALAAVEAIRNTGFEVHAWPDAPESTSAGVGSDHEHEHAATTGSGLPRLLAALALATAAEGLSFLVPDAPWSKWVGLAVAAAAIALAGFSTFSKGLTALRHGRLNINALMSVAVAGAFVIGQWPEAAMVMALYAIAELIEARSVDRARNAISGLLALSPDTADLRQPDGAWKTVPVGDVPIGATVRVRPGERVAMDAVVTERQHQPGPGARHWREPAGGQGAWRCGLRRHHQPDRHDRVPSHRRSVAIDAGPHHPRRRAGPGQPCTHAALR